MKLNKDLFKRASHYTAMLTAIAGSVMSTAAVADISPTTLNAILIGGLAVTVICQLITFKAGES